MALECITLPHVGGIWRKYRVARGYAARKGTQALLLALVTINGVRR